MIPSLHVSWGWHILVFWYLVEQLGVLWKLNFPFNWALIEGYGLLWEQCSRFKVSSACSYHSSHSQRENNLSTITNPAIKWILKVWIVHSVALTWCWFGSMNWILVCISDSIKCQTMLETSLSITWNVGYWLLYICWWTSSIEPFAYNSIGLTSMGSIPQI